MYYQIGEYLPVYLTIIFQSRLDFGNLVVGWISAIHANILGFHHVDTMMASNLFLLIFSQ